MSLLLTVAMVVSSLIGIRPVGAAILDLRVAASANDAEEFADGTVSLTSPDLQLVQGTSNQTVGVRWTGLTIPPGSTITTAYIQFSARASQSGATNLVLQGQAADSPPAFATTSGNISTRTRTSTTSNWAPVAWTAGETSVKERTPDLSAVIQEVVSRPGWASGNALVMIVTGTGQRTAWSYDGKRSKAPLLHVEYNPPDFAPVAKLAVTQVATPALTVSASGSGSTDTDLTPIASYHFDFGDGTPVVTTTAPTAIAQHTYAAAGSYTVTLTVTDTGSLTSSPVSTAITVQPDSAPVAGLGVTQLASPALTVRADASGSTDTDLTPIASYHFNFGDGTPVVNTTAPTAIAQHTYAAAGSYTVTLTVTDTGSLTSSPASAVVTVTPPPDLPPVASLAASQLASPALTVSASGSGSTDTDLTPIASYHFDFGDSTPVVTTTAPTATAQHTYAAAGSYTVTLTVTDTGNLTSNPVNANINVTSPAGPQVSVYAGYYDTHHAVNTQPKPDPWRGSPNTVFVGQQDNQPGDPPSGAWDTSALRIDNLTAGSLSGVVVTADIGTHHFALWGTQTVPAGQHLVLAQTAFEKFDGSDLNAAGCYGCDPALCVTLHSSTVPVVHVTIGGVTTDYFDTGQYLNTHGADAAGCPYVGGPLPQTRYDESEAWVQIYPTGSTPSQSTEPAAGAAPPVVNFSPRTLWLAPPAPNPSRGELAVRFTTPLAGPVRVSLYDLAGRVVHRFVDNVLESGDYSFRVDLADVRPGIYFLDLWTPGASRHERLVLMR